MRKNFSTFFLLAAMLTFAACSRQSRSGNYTFINQTDRLVRVFIYRTHSDYIEGDYPVVSGSVQANGSYSVPMDALTDSRSYYAEWYSDNFDYNNWADSLEGLKFTPSDNTPFYITQSEKNNIRKLCLSGNVAQTNWLAIDAFSDTDLTTSVWTQLTDSEKYFHVQLTRRFNGFYDYTSGHTIHDSISYSVHQDATGIHIQFSGVSQAEMTSSSPPSATTPSSIDTAWIHTNGKRYLMLKQ